MNVFLVHGSIGKPFENWFPWIENELSSRDIVTNIPTFPTPQGQNYANWAKLMDYYVELGVVNSETILIAHSCGCIFLARYLIEKKIKVQALICFSGYNNFVSGYEFMDNLNKTFYTDLSCDDVTKYAKHVSCFYGDNDPNIPESYLRDFAKQIHAHEARCISNAGHFNAAAGFTTCPLALETVIKYTTQ